MTWQILEIHRYGDNAVLPDRFKTWEEAYRLCRRFNAAIAPQGVLLYVPFNPHWEAEAQERIRRKESSHV